MVSITTVQVWWPSLLLTAALLLAGCVSPLVTSPEVTVQAALSTPTVEATFTPAPPPINTPQPSRTVTPAEPTPMPTSQSAAVSGRILDQDTSQPIAGATVRVGTATATTDAEGRYTLTGLPPGQYVLSVIHPGYDPGLSSIFTLAAGQEHSLGLTLYASDTSPYPKDPMLTNPLDPNGAPTAEDAGRLAREQGLTGEVVDIRETKLSGEYLVNYKIGDEIRAAVAKINHDVWELTDETDRKWWIIKVCGNLASPLPAQKPIPTPKPTPFPPMAEVVGDELIVRACASEECAEVGTVPPGERVEVFGCLADNSWCGVSWSGVRGWCTERSLRQLAVATVIPSATPVLPTPRPTPTPTVTPTIVAPGEGKIIFVGQDGAIRVINPDGSGETRLTDGSAQDLYPAWSPDGRRIAFSRNFKIYIMDADGSNQTRLTNTNNQEVGPDWSPDGQQIIFSLFESPGKSGIYVMNTDGSGLTRLADGGWPAWSPDGQRIAFSRDPFGLYVVNVDGSGLTRLSNEGTWLDWSPDGEQIAFTSSRHGNQEIYVVNADGSGLTRLTNQPEDDQFPTWSPDGQQIAFGSLRDGGGWHIYVMAADGSGLTLLASGSEPAWSR
jgi:hypothetical protein